MGKVTLDVCRGKVKESIDVPDDSVYLGAQGLTSIDLSPLSESTRLQNLWLYNNGIEDLDLTALGSCTHLRSLSLRNNRLNSLNLKPLGQCLRLEELDLSDNEIRNVDLEPIGWLNNLRRLDLSGNSLKRLVLNPIASCSNLGALVIGDSESRRSDSLRAKDEASVQRSWDFRFVEAVDVSPLVWCDHLSTFVARGQVDLTLDPALWYVAATKVLASADTVTSAPRDKAAPVLAWMNPSLFSRLTPLNYEAIATQTDTRNLRSIIIRNIKRVSRKHWYHSQKGMLEGFALPQLSGYDGNPLSILDLPSFPREYAGFRTALRKHVVSLVRRQIAAGGPTLFMEVDALLTEDESALAKAVVRAEEGGDGWVSCANRRTFC